MHTLIHIFHFYRHLFVLAVVGSMWIFPFNGWAIPSDKDEKPESTEYIRKAEKIMQKVFKYVDNQHFHIEEYNSDVYMRHRMHTKRKGPIARFFPEMLRLEPGENDYLTEVRLRFQYRPPGENDCKIVGYHSTARYQKASRFISMSRFNFQIYDSKLFLDCILNPLHHRNRRFYRYRYIFTSKVNDRSYTTVRIAIRPRFKNDQLAKGYVDVNPANGAVCNFFFTLRFQTRNLTVSGRTGTEGFETLMPQRMRVLSDFKLFGNHINEVYEIYSKHTFSETRPKTKDGKDRLDITEQCMLRVDTARYINEISYFDSIRPIPLRPFEKELLEQYSLSSPSSTTVPPSFEKRNQSEEEENRDSLSGYPHESNKAKNRSMNFFYRRTEEILLSSHAFNFGNEGRAHVKLPALITPSRIGWSRTKGFSLKARSHWDIFLSSKDFEPTIEFDPSIGYSFKQKQIYWDLPLHFRFSPRYDGMLTLEAGGGSHMYNSKQADGLRDALKDVEKYDSIMKIIDSYGFHDYRDMHASLDVGLSPFPGLRFTLGGRFHKHTLIEWNKVADNSGLKHYFTSLGPRFQIEWTPRQYYYWKGPRRMPLYSKYPTFLFNYERGYAIGRSNTHYERFEFDTRYRLPLYAMRTIYLRAGGGVYTQRGNECFLNYDFFKFNYMPDKWNDDLTGEFQLLDARWYNESRYYLRFTGTYESPMLLMTRIPGISRIIQKERVYLNLLSVRSLGFYTELGYGISTHLLDIGTFMSIAPDHSLDFGFKFVLKFFDD